MRGYRLYLPGAGGAAGLALFTGAVFLAALVGLFLHSGASTQLIFLIASLPAAAGLVLFSPRTATLALVLWTVALGLLRRLFPTGGSSAIGDPLLLVAPAVFILLFFMATGSGALRERTPLAKAVFGLSVLALIEAINPLQGGLTVGVGGLLLVLAPMLMFWVGRSLVDDGTLRRIFALVAVLGVASAIYGLVQTYGGFPSWDKSWLTSELASGKYNALYVGGVIRAFASFTSAQEYVVFLAVAFIVVFAWGMKVQRLPIMVPVVVFLGVSIFLESSRGEVVYTVVAIGVLIACAAGVSGRTAILGGVVALLVLSLTVGHFASSTASNVPAGASPTSALVGHQLAGLSNPLSSTSSTLSGHVRRVASGVASGFTDPIGHGTGSITTAAQKFGGTSAGTESDPSNAAEAFGIVGLVFYLLVLYRGLVSAYMTARTRRDSLAFGVLGLLLVGIFQWLNGDLYSVTWLIWLALGWADRASRQSWPASQQDDGIAALMAKDST